MPTASSVPWLCAPSSKAGPCTGLSPPATAVQGVSGEAGQVQQAAPAPWPCRYGAARSALQTCMGLDPRVPTPRGPVPCPALMWLLSAAGAKRRPGSYRHPPSHLPETALQRAPSHPWGVSGGGRQVHPPSPPPPRGLHSTAREQGSKPSCGETESGGLQPGRAPGRTCLVREGLGLHPSSPRCPQTLRL